MALRTPTLLNSTERQLGQRAENTSGARLCGAAGGCGGGVAEALAGGNLGLISTRTIMTAGCAGGFDLFGRAKVRLRELHLGPFAGNLPLVALG